MKTCVAVLILLLALPVMASGKLRLTAGASLLSAADEGFQTIYGSSAVMPELTASYQAYKALHLRLSVAAFSKSGTVSGPFAETCKTRQVLVGFAPEWVQPLGARLKLGVHAGGFYVAYREEAFDQTVKDNALGLDAGAGLYLRIAARALACLNLGYARAADTVSGQDVTLGGFRAGIGLGIQL